MNVARNALMSVVRHATTRHARQMTVASSFAQWGAPNADANVEMRVAAMV